MALDKQALIGIMSALPESAIIQGLSAAGIDVTGAAGGVGMDSYDLPNDQGGGDEKLQSWNARQVTVPDAQRPPLFDKSQILDQKPPMPQPRPYAQPDPPASNLAPFAAGATAGASVGNRGM